MYKQDQQDPDQQEGQNSISKWPMSYLPKYKWEVDTLPRSQK